MDPVRPAHRPVRRLLAVAGLVLATLLPLVAAAGPADALPMGHGLYTPVPPHRMADTRDGTGGVAKARIGPGGVLKVSFAGQVPPGATAVVLNVTAVGPTAATHLTVWPGVKAMPATSTLNVVAGETRANNVTVGLAPDNSVKVSNHAGLVDVVVDLSGYYSTQVLGQAAGFMPVKPTRIFDTRTGTGGPKAKLGPASTTTFTVAGMNGVPPIVWGVVLNVTAINPSTGTHLTLYPSTLGARPLASNVNAAAGTVTPNLAVVEVGSDNMAVYNNSGSTDVAVDIVGYYAPGAPWQFAPIDPYRVSDTRTWLPSGIGPGQALAINMASSGIVDAESPTLVGNLAGVAPTQATHLSMVVDPGNPPSTSNVNLAAGQTAANAVYAPVSATRNMYIRNNAGSTHVVFDITGYFYTPY